MLMIFEHNSECAVAGIAVAIGYSITVIPSTKSVRSLASSDDSQVISLYGYC